VKVGVVIPLSPNVPENEPSTPGAVNVIGIIAAEAADAPTQAADARTVATRRFFILKTLSHYPHRQQSSAGSVPINYSWAVIS
jgi:hypothetical protein